MAYLRLSFSNMPLYSELFKCREFESFQTVFFGFFHLWFLTSFFAVWVSKKPVTTGFLALSSILSVLYGTGDRN